MATAGSTKPLPAIVSVGVKVASKRWPSLKRSVSVTPSKAKKSETWKASVYSSTSPGVVVASVRLATDFWMAIDRSLSVCSGPATSIVMGVIGSRLSSGSQEAAALALSSEMRSSPLAGGSTAAPRASNCGTKNSKTTLALPLTEPVNVHDSVPPGMPGRRRRAAGDRTDHAAELQGCPAAYRSIVKPGHRLRIGDADGQRVAPREVGAGGGLVFRAGVGLGQRQQRGRQRTAWPPGSVDGGRVDDDRIAAPVVERIGAEAEAAARLDRQRRRESARLLRVACTLTVTGGWSGAKDPKGSSSTTSASPAVPQTCRQTPEVLRK